MGHITISADKSHLSFQSSSMGASRHRRSFILLTFLSFTPFFTNVSGQSTLESIPTASSLPSSLPVPLPSDAPLTSSGRPIPCGLKNTKLNPSTHKLISDCAPQTFCLAPPDSPANATDNGICVRRRCRRDNYPFGYARFGGVTNGVAEVPRAMVKGKLVLVADDDPLMQAKLPPVCSPDSFCPDNGSGCRLKLGSGGTCELGRDEQCQNPPFDGAMPEGSLNRAVCLMFKCLPATQPFNAPCTFENMTYVADIDKGLAGGGQFTSFVFKHNCLSPFLFCDRNSLDAAKKNPTCQLTRKVGRRCTFDEECESGNCEEKACALPVGMAVELTPWHWGATIMFILASLVISFSTLVYIHRQRRRVHYQGVREYYEEQMSLRRLIVTLQASGEEKFSKGTD